MRRAFLSVVPGGAVVELGDRAVIGRSPDCEVQVDADAVSRRHAEVLRGGDGFVITDLGSTGGTFVASRGQPAERAPRHRPLADEDRIFFGHRYLVFTLDAPLRLPPDGKVGVLEKALSENPDDDGLWRVYGDVLLERADRFGRRVVEQSTTWPALDGNLGNVTSLQVTWRHGHLREATLGPTPRYVRNVANARFAAGFTSTLQQLLTAPIARFLVALQLDLPAGFFDAVESTLFALLATLEHPTLRRLSFGPFFEDSAAARIHIPERPLRGSHLGARELLRYGAAWLDRDGRRELLERGQVVQLPFSREIGIELSYSEERWRIRSTCARFAQGAIRINEHLIHLSSERSLEHLLRPGDVLVIGDSIIRFDAERGT